ncbi:hypothetical protein WMY93_002313 [Mugilogobius chulae]|uniref:Uncharacterized protein n=1 Tax=Mugilogobius chulae TaxID=88201 RepID=A0AAW0PWU3_9GOBI
MEMMYVVFRGNKRISLRGEDLTTGKIAMIFQVRADSIYLTDDHNRAVLPLPNGAFESQDLLMSSHYEVHGESSASEGEASTSGQTPIRFAFRRPSNSTPTASTNHPSSRAASLKMLQRNVFIAELLDGHLETQKTVTIKFSEFEASVNNIKAKVTEALGHDEPIVLIDSHQNEIMDCEGTRALLSGNSMPGKSMLFQRSSYRDIEGRGGVKVVSRTHLFQKFLTKLRKWSLPPRACRRSAAP